MNEKCITYTNLKGHFVNVTSSRTCINHGVQGRMILKLQIAVSRASLIFQKRFPDAVST